MARPKKLRYVHIKDEDYYAAVEDFFDAAMDRVWTSPSDNDASQSHCANEGAPVNDLAFNRAQSRFRFLIIAALYFKGDRVLAAWAMSNDWNDRVLHRCDELWERWFGENTPSEMLAQLRLEFQPKLGLRGAA